MTEDISHLLELANRILQTEESEAELLSLIQEYSNAFSSWYESAGAGADLAGLEKAYGAETLKRLANQHRLILDRAASLKEQTSEELRKLKRRGKGILAYTDTMPRRISVRRNRKG